MGSVAQQASDRSYGMADNNFSDIVSAQQNFAEQHSVEHPEHAMSSYARYIHEHTKAQLEKTTTAARRQSNDAMTPGFTPHNRVSSMGS